MKKTLFVLLMIMVLALVGCVPKATQKSKNYGQPELKQEMEQAVKEMNSVISECK